VFSRTVQLEEAFFNDAYTESESLVLWATRSHSLGHSYPPRSPRRCPGVSRASRNSRLTKLGVNLGLGHLASRPIRAVFQQAFPPVRLLGHRDIVGLDVCKGKRTWPTAASPYSEVRDSSVARS
jgi:hypothetical protein